MKIIILLISALTLLLSNSLVAQQDTSKTNSAIKISAHKVLDQTEPEQIYQDPKVEQESIKFISSKEFWLGIIVLIVLLVIISVIYYLIKSKGINDDSSIKLLLTTIVVFSVLFLAVSGFDDRTTAAAFGLLGAVLGYIFGKNEKH